MNPKYLLRKIWIVLLMFSVGSACFGQLRQPSRPYLSYAEADFSNETITIIKPNGSSAISDISVINQGDIAYVETERAWMMDSTHVEPITFKVDLLLPTMLQVSLKVDFNGITPTNPKDFTIKVNGKALDFYVLESTAYEAQYVMVQVSEAFTRMGQNIIEITEKRKEINGPLLESVRFLPQKIIASNNTLNTTLFSQFGQTKLMNGPNRKLNPIWTRAYGLAKTTEMIPGPILYYKPGDLVNVELVNLLNPKTSPALDDFSKVQRKQALQDEILSGHKVKGDLNIPHGLNFTNLHVHGLHVDPDRDDVLLVIKPEGMKVPEHTNPLIAASDKIDGSWLYEYQLPKIHLPGTHWYHPHKHGSTSAQLENGMAGTMVIMEDEHNAIVPYPVKADGVDSNNGIQNYYDLDRWRAEHDRVLAIQEVSNYGLQEKESSDDTKRRIDRISDNTFNQDTLGVTVNGIDELNLKIKAGQLERWRLVNAGTNHRAYSHIWLGKNTGEKTKGKDKLPIFESVDIHLVAVDGITLSKKVTVNAMKPASMAPGNRSDFLIQIDEPGNYVLFKNYSPKEGIALQDERGKIIYKSTDGNTDFWPAIANQKNNTFVFANKGINADSYLGFQAKWGAKDTLDIAPLIKVKPIVNDKGQFLDVDFASAADFKSQAKGLWIPVSGNAGLRTESELIWLEVTKDRVGPNESPIMPSDAHLEKIAPNTTKTPPGYVGRFADKDILQSRPIVFDVSGIRINVETPARQKSINVPQFTLNGRFFRGDDRLGSAMANKFIQEGYRTPADLNSQADGKVKLTFNQRRSNFWSNKVGDRWYFTNPGYYQPITESGGSFQFNSTGTHPSWAAVTGIPNNGAVPLPSVVNTKAKKYDINKALVPGEPLARTGEEWILINNSDVSHPFHIHINPFFVTEVGQLSYEEYLDENNHKQTDWFMRAVTTTMVSPWAQRSEMPGKGAVPGTVYKGEISAGAIVGNWWDTLTIPAHGYVKVRYWFNVPKQEKAGGGFIVHENVNRVGTWVYHCHILRHEDRGMMMLVGSEKSNEE